MISFKGVKALKDLDSVSLAVKLRKHFVLNFPLAEVQRLDDAIQLASYLHRNDVRRGERGKMPNPPYIEHPLRVALRLVEFCVEDSDILIAAILHDTVEDHPFEFSDFETVHKQEDESDARKAALEYISKTFGYSVASIVDLVSNPILPSGISKPDKIQSYLDHVGGILGSSEEARILKFSDFVDNAGSLHHHYAYDSPKVKYFIERYSPLLVQYRRAFGLYGSDTYDLPRVLVRLEQVEGQFAKFRAGLDISSGL